MKVALLSDIHANAPALEAVLAQRRRYEWDQLVVCGDSIGYYFWPGRVVELLHSTNAVVIAGNHETMLGQVWKGLMSADDVRCRYGPGIDVALDELNHEQLTWLTQLPHPLVLRLPEGQLILSHGTPGDIDAYAYPDTDLANLVDTTKLGTTTRWVAMGHTHYPMDRYFAGKRFVNPGSVGQPRNRRDGAHWALLETTTSEVQFISTPYDQRSVAREARRRWPQLPYLADILDP